MWNVFVCGCDLILELCAIFSGYVTSYKPNNNNKICTYLILFIFPCTYMSKHPNHLSHIYIRFDELSGVHGCHCALLSTYIRAAAIACSHSFRHVFASWCFFLWPSTYTYVAALLCACVCLLFSHSYLLQFYGVLLWCTEYTVEWKEQRCVYVRCLMCTWYTMPAHTDDTHP